MTYWSGGIEQSWIKIWFVRFNIKWNIDFKYDCKIKNIRKILNNQHQNRFRISHAIQTKNKNIAFQLK